jgi:hypothetical protein
MDTNYWLGPYNVRVSNSVKKIKSIDGVNTIYRDGGETEMISKGSLTEEQYLDRYTVLKEDGNYYWRS